MRLNIGVVSSFCATGLRQLMDSHGGWPVLHTNIVELYAFMEEDVNWLFKPNRRISAFEAIASSGTTPEEVAKTLAIAFAEQKIAAVCSYFPEILGHSTIAHLAEKSLVFLVRTINELRYTYGHPVRTLVLVAGSATGGVHIGNPNDDPTFGTRTFSLLKLGASGAGMLLLERTRYLSEIATELDVDLALELEPGPLYTLNSLASMHAFCDLLRDEGTAHQRSHIGFNLNIPHWSFLSGITIEQLRRPENAMITDRIIHVHVSDQVNGHFCDKAMVKGGQHDQEFQRWLSYSNEISGIPRVGALRHSGVVSLELECCNSLVDVEVSLEYLSEMLATQSDAG